MWYKRGDNCFSWLCLCRPCLIWNIWNGTSSYVGCMQPMSTTVIAGRTITLTWSVLRWASCERMAKRTRCMCFSICSRRLPLQQLANGKARFSKRRVPTGQVPTGRELQLSWDNLSAAMTKSRARVHSLYHLFLHSIVPGCTFVQFATQLYTLAARACSRCIPS